MITTLHRNRGPVGCGALNRPGSGAKLQRTSTLSIRHSFGLVVPTWTLLAALTAGLILGALGARLFQRPPPTLTLPPAATAAPEPEEATLQTPAAEEPEPDPQPVTPPAPAPEPVRISMEDVVSELERRYQGRQADASGEKPRPGGRRRRTR
jgi:hypothetical protein